MPSPSFLFAIFTSLEEDIGLVPSPLPEILADVFVNGLPFFASLSVDPNESVSSPLPDNERAGK